MLGLINVTLFEVISIWGVLFIAILGIGSPLRGDDALGLAIIKELKKSLRKQKKRMPLKMLIDYLIQSLGCRIVSIGIQPKSIEFGTSTLLSANGERSRTVGLSISNKVNKAIKKISHLIIESSIN